MLTVHGLTTPSIRRYMIPRAHVYDATCVQAYVRRNVGDVRFPGYHIFSEISGSRDFHEEKLGNSSSENRISMGFIRFQWILRDFDKCFT